MSETRHDWSKATITGGEWGPYSRKVQLGIGAAPILGFLYFDPSVDANVAQRIALDAAEFIANRLAEHARVAQETIHAA